MVISIHLPVILHSLAFLVPHPQTRQHTTYSGLFTIYNFRGATTTMLGDFWRENFTASRDL